MISHIFYLSGAQGFQMSFSLGQTQGALHPIVNSWVSPVSTTTSKKHLCPSSWKSSEKWDVSWNSLCHPWTASSLTRKCLQAVFLLRNFQTLFSLTSTCKKNLQGSRFSNFCWTRKYGREQLFYPKMSCRIQTCSSPPPSHPPLAGTAGVWLRLSTF